ncbi:MAG: 3-ketoacyl-ACP reductase [Terracidiphilus sp.]|nr:3-ketoacyl-ACP reductase [Terracidiphilus sp.]
MTTPKNRRPVAIVTGGFRGIGRGCARALARAGFLVLVNDRDTEENRAAQETFAAEFANVGAEAEFLLGDVSDLALHAALVERAVGRWGRIDCLANNAGVSVKSRGDLLDVTPESFDNCIAVNTRAVFFLCQAVARQMLAGDGEPGVHRSIINITSSNVKAVSINRGEYCVSKSASSMTTKLFALRLASAGIGVYEIRPGLILTEMTAPSKPHYDAMIADGFVPMGRWGYPEDVAATVVSMATGQLAYTVGQAIAIDGGMVMPRY